MNVQDQIDQYVTGQPEAKREDMRALHALITRIAPGCRLWFEDGRNSEGKVVSNPNIGYGFHTMRYADGTSRDFFQVGQSANTGGLSVYLIGVKDKAYLAETFGERLGKAGVTGYCIKFKKLKDVNLDVLEEAIRYGFTVTGG